MEIPIPTHLSDLELISSRARLAHCERDATTRLVAHLAEFEARALHLGAGFPSLFAYCCEVLHLSEHESGNRIAAARAARRYPIVLELLASGALNLTAVRLLAPHLTKDNHQELFAAATHKRKSEIEELIAQRFPRPDVVSSVRKVPTRPSVASVSATSLSSPPTPAAPQNASESSLVPTPCHQMAASVHGVPAPPTLAPPARRATIAPLGLARYEIRFTASAETRDKLRRAQEQLRHAVPSGDPAEIFDRALTSLLEELARTRIATVRSSSNERRGRAATAGSRHIPARVRRTVWLRDGGQCAFVARGGRRCSTRAFLEFHHVKPYGVRGEATDGNIELRCRSHNAYEAELFYGPMRDRVNERRARYVSGPPRCARASPA